MYTIIYTSKIDVYIEIEAAIAAVNAVFSRYPIPIPESLFWNCT